MRVSSEKLTLGPSTYPMGQVSTANLTGTRPVILYFILLVTGTCVTCTRSEPPGAGSVAPAAPRNVGSTAPGAVSSSYSANHSESSSPSPASLAASVPLLTDDATDLAVASSSSATQLDPLLFDAAGQPRAQTEELPSATDPSFQARIEMLCSAVIKGHPDTAHGAFFPLVAYRQVKAVADPDRDYRLRLLRHFDRDISEYHRRITSQRGPMRCSGVRLPKEQARWMKPGSEYNRIGYFRVLRSQLDLTDADGNTTTLEVTSLISWRGQWYVVHLHGFE